jgi:hypothetical protein
LNEFHSRARTRNSIPPRECVIEQEQPSMAEVQLARGIEDSPCGGRMDGSLHRGRQAPGETKQVAGARILIADNSDQRTVRR